LTWCQLENLFVPARYRTVQQAQPRNPDLRERVRIGFEAYTATLAAEPDLTKTLLVEVLAAGPSALPLTHVRNRGESA
jgi:hypothetical protein